jgi:pimeloyl-ACP methyl ester carboxylesterase
MTIHAHQTAPTQFVEAKGIRFAYRRFGKASGVPLVLNTTSVEGMAANAVAFIKALGLSQVDVLGFSLGGLVAQDLTLAAPELVRRLVRFGTSPRSGESMASLTPEAQKIIGATYDPPDHLWLGVFFTPSEASQAAGRAYLKRFRRRTEGRDPEVNEKVAPAQLEALAKWGAPRANPSRLAVPVSGTVRPARLDVPVRRRRVSASRFRIDQSIKEIQS